MNESHLLHETTSSRLRKVAVLSNVKKPMQSVKENKENRAMCISKCKPCLLFSADEERPPVSLQHSSEFLLWVLIQESSR